MQKPVVAIGKFIGNPDVGLDVAHLPRQKQLETWQRISAPNGDIVVTDETRADATPIDSIAWNLGPLYLTKSRFPKATLIRTAHHIRQSHSDYYRVRIFRGGGGEATLDGSPTSVVPNDMHFVHGTSTLQMTVRGDDVIGMLIPAGMIGFDASDERKSFCFPGQNPATRLFRSVLETTLEGMPKTQPSVFPQLAKGLLGLVREFLGHAPGKVSENHAHRKLQRRALRRYVEQNLTDPDLSADILVEKFNVSRASIYRYFSEYGGLRKYAPTLRLDRSMMDLVAAEKSRGAVGRIAERWGFSDMANYGRQFRRRFGIPPGEALGVRTAQSNSSCERNCASIEVFPEFADLYSRPAKPIKEDSSIVSGTAHKFRRMSSGVSCTSTSATASRIAT